MIEAGAQAALSAKGGSPWPRQESDSHPGSTHHDTEATGYRERDAIGSTGITDVADVLLWTPTAMDTQ